MNEQFTLYGADRFAAYLRRTAEIMRATLWSVGPYRVGSLFGRQAWSCTVLLNGRTIGNYIFVEPVPGETDTLRAWDGEIPGAVGKNFHLLWFTDDTYAIWYGLRRHPKETPPGTFRRVDSATFFTEFP